MGILYSFILKKMSDEEENYDFPKTLTDFGYKFNEAGQLRNIETDNGFNFEERAGNHKYNQKRYEAIGDIITDYIYDLLEEEGLKRISIPVDAKENEPTSFFFQTEDAQSNSDKLLILIHGSGPVKAGQWARRLIMNDCLDSGTQIPFIKWGITNGYGVIVANTNINTVKEDNTKKKIRGSESPEEHMLYLWKNFVQPSKAKNIAIVAHSYGGVSTLHLVNTHIEEFKKRVFAIALTDSVHSFQHQKDGGKAAISFFKERAINWASAYDPLDTKLKTTMDHTPTLSAGTDKHEYTSYSSMNSIFKWFMKKYAEHTGTPLPDDLDLKNDESDLNSSKKKVDTEETPMSQDLNEDLPMSQNLNVDLPMSKETEKEEPSVSTGTNEESEEPSVSTGTNEESQMSLDTQDETTSITNKVKSEL